MLYESILHGWLVTVRIHQPREINQLSRCCSLSQSFCSFCHHQNRFAIVVYVSCCFANRSPPNKFSTLQSFLQISNQRKILQSSMKPFEFVCHIFVTIHLCFHSTATSKISSENFIPFMVCGMEFNKIWQHNRSLKQKIQNRNNRVDNLKFNQFHHGSLQVPRRDVAQEAVRRHAFLASYEIQNLIVKTSKFE